MAQATLEVPYRDTPRDRGTVAIRILLAIPHFVLVQVWNYVMGAVTVISWFIQVFTGKRNRGLAEFANRWLSYAAHVWTYAGLMYDEYPGFIDDQGRTPVRYEMTVEEGPVDRLKVGIRILWAIPALVVGYFLSLAGFVVTVVAWFAILFTGSFPRGQFDFALAVHRYMVELYAYTLLLTDEYPVYRRAQASGAMPAPI